MSPAPFPLIDCTLWIDDYDFTGDSNKLKVAGMAAPEDSTVFGGGGYRRRTGGVKDVSVAASGFLTMGAGEVEADLFPDLGTADRVITASPTGLAGSVAYLLRATKFDLELLGQHGQLAPWSMNALCSNSQGLLRGQVSRAKGTVSATGALGSGVQLGAVGAAQYLYGSLHIFGTPGTTVTVVLESDDNAGFSSATTRATLGPLTTAGGNWVTRVAGAITDDYFRYRVTAITGTFTIGGAIAVGS